MIVDELIFVFKILELYFEKVAQTFACARCASYVNARLQVSRAI
jgi:hypothetical protein